MPFVPVLVTPRWAFFRCLMCCMGLWGGCILGVSAAETATTTEVLTDSNLSPFTDSQGMVWDISQDGQIQDGSNDCFDGGMRANVPGRGWNCEEQKQTADAQEYVLIGKSGNLEYTRRIRMDAPKAWIRYLEIIHNPSDKAVPCNLEIQSNLGGNAQVFSTDGKPFSGGALAKGNVGFAALQQQQGQSRPSVLWLVGDGLGAIKPMLSSQGGRSLKVRWTMTVPPKGTVTLLHLMAQRNALNPTQLADALKPVFRRQLVKPNVPAGTTIDNWQTAVEVVRGLPMVEALAEQYAIEDRSADTVILDSGDGARMRGQLTGGPLQVATRLGSGPVPLAQIAASVAVEGSLRFYLRDGEVLVADPASPSSGTIELASAEGVRLPIEASRSQAVVMRHEATDGQPGAAVGYLKLVDGTRLAVTGTLPVLPVLSTWGAVEIPFARITKLTRVREPRPAWRIHLDDGSVITAVPGAAALVLPTVRYGVKSVPLTLIGGYDRVLAGTELPSDDGPPPTWRGFMLDGNQWLAGGFAEAQLELFVAGVSTVVPTAKIQSCSREGVALAVHLLDGATAAGQLTNPVAISGGAATWRVPGSMIAKWANGVVPKVEGKAEGKVEEKPATEPAAAEEEECVDDEAAPVAVPAVSNPATSPSPFGSVP